MRPGKMVEAPRFELGTPSLGGLSKTIEEFCKQSFINSNWLRQALIYRIRSGEELSENVRISLTIDASWASAPVRGWRRLARIGRATDTAPSQRRSFVTSILLPRFSRSALIFHQPKRSVS